MNQNELTKFQKQIEAAHGMGEELLNKVEFEFLIPYFFEDELLNSLSVVECLDKLYLIGFSNERFFMVEKNELNLFSFQRFGLEEISNLQLVKDQLVMSLNNSKLDQLVFSGMNETKAKSFGKSLVQAIQAWNDRF